MIPVNKIREKLLKKQQTVEEEIKNLDADDPVLSDQTPESSEPGTDSWLADVHSRAQASKLGLEQMLDKVKKALKKLNNGKYGKCENCGNPIEDERLDLVPEATLCITCSKKKSK